MNFPVKNRLALGATLVIISLAVLASGEHHDPYGKPPPKPHYFSYAVKDPYTGTDFEQSEKSDGKTVRGSYSVQLPDGRKQIVTYEADHYKGFTAKVTYEGKAKYPPKSKYPPFTVPPHHGPAPHHGPPSHYEPKPHYH